MGKISKKKRKGRPSKADISRPSSAGIRRNKGPDPPRESDLRRSIRRRNMKYTDEFYDDEEEEEEVERRKEKKMKLVLRLAGQGRVDSFATRSGEGKVDHASAPEKSVSPAAVAAPAVSASSSEYGDDRERIRDAKGIESVPGLASNYPSGIPLPDKKQLELILDKLQKKDTYGVYAEPVDPEELPDYHDVIENPMDFGTIRKKLENSTYTKLEELEADVFLLCSNAMQYNAPETIYFKQARSIQELARKKFERLRIDFERTEAELKSEQKTKSNFVAKKPIKKSACRILQEPVGSDFSSGATLATMAETCNWSNATQAGGGCERPGNFDGLVDGNSCLAENRSEKTEEQLSGKGFPSKFGKKPFVLDENRRATYSISNQHFVKNESMFTIFEDENKQLVAVGLHADYSYARSLARFAATLGPVAWKVASRRIEQALPVGFRFGRGWVGEYEPLPTSVLVLENHSQKELFKNLQSTDNSRKDDQTVEEGLKATKEDVKLGLGTINSSGLTSTSSLPDSARDMFSGSTSKENLGLIRVARPKPMINAVWQQQNPLVTSYVRSDNNVLKQVELNSSSSVSEDPMNISSLEQAVNNSQMATSRLLEMVSRNKSRAHSVPFKQPESDGVVSGGLPNGKAVSNSSNNHKAGSFPSDFVPNQQVRAPTCFPHGNHEQGLSDPVQMLRMIAEKTQNQQKSSNHPMIDAPQSRKDDSSTAATAPAQPWMTLGVAQVKITDSAGPSKMQIAASSLNSPTGELQSVSQVNGEPPVSGGLQLQPDKKRFHPQAFLPQAVRISEEPRFLNNRPVFFPQLAITDLSRFQVQSPWQGLTPHTQPNKKQDTLPPDLNIGFQSSGSPVRQSSGVLVDSQQPDLALQL
ncbi:Bromodomain [Macleaya cordata]|uniref:Bromodomain n=1 Tax=Macleaya cordata TaxID=56857 RepID=A0A200QBJ1_MACCD|nr:Bromodomain [Macleaya cordata]